MIAKIGILISLIKNKTDEFYRFKFNQCMNTFELMLYEIRNKKNCLSSTLRDIAKIQDYIDSELRFFVWFSHKFRNDKSIALVENYIDEIKVETNKLASLLLIHIDSPDIEFDNVHLNDKRYDLYLQNIRSYQQLRSLVNTPKKNIEVSNSITKLWSRYSVN